MSTAAAAAAAADHKSGMRPRAFAEGPEPKRTSASEAVARSNGSAAASDALGAAPPPGATGAAAAAASDAPAAVRRTIARRTTSRAAADVARARTMAQLTSLAKGSSAESAAYQRPCFEYHTGGGMCKNEGNCAFAHGDVNAAKNFPEWVRKVLSLQAEPPAGKRKAGAQAPRPRKHARPAAAAGDGDEKDDGAEAVEDDDDDDIIDLNANPPPAVVWVDSAVMPRRNRGTLIFTATQFEELLALRKNVSSYARYLNMCVVTKTATAVHISTGGSHYQNYLSRVPEACLVKIDDEGEAAMMVDGSDHDHSNSEVVAGVAASDPGPAPQGRPPAQPITAASFGVGAGDRFNRLAALNALAGVRVAGDVVGVDAKQQTDAAPAAPAAQRSRGQIAQSKATTDAAVAAAAPAPPPPPPAPTPAPALAPAPAPARAAAPAAAAAPTAPAVASLAGKAPAAAPVPAAAAAGAAAAAVPPANADIADIDVGDGDRRSDDDDDSGDEDGGGDDDDVDLVADVVIKMQRECEAAEKAALAGDSTRAQAWRKTYATQIAAAFRVEVEMAERRAEGMDSKVATTLIFACVMEIGKRRGWTMADRGVRAVVSASVFTELSKRKFGMQPSEETWRKVNALLTAFEADPNDAAIFALIKRASSAAPTQSAVDRAANIMAMDGRLSAAMRRCELIAAVRK